MHKSLCALLAVLLAGQVFPLAHAMAANAAVAIAAAGADESYTTEAELPRIEALAFKSEGSLIYGQVLVPAAKFAGARPCVIFCHGFAGFTRWDDVAHDLCRAGIAVVIPHHRGAWGSEGEYTVSGCIRDAENLARWAMDAATVAQYGFDTNAVYLVGHSMGGNSVVNAAARLKGVRGVALVAPCDIGFMAQQMRREELKCFLIGEGMQVLRRASDDSIVDDIIANAAEMRFAKAAKALDGKKVFLVTAEYDRTVPTKPLDEFWAVLGDNVMKCRRTYRTGHSLMGARRTFAADLKAFIDPTRSLCGQLALKSSSRCAATPEEVAKAHKYPVRYCAVTNTAEVRQALVAELWKHDTSADTKLWPDGQVPLRDNDRPIKMLEHELWQRNLVVTDINDPFFTFFPAAGAGTKPVVVILPGGGYLQLGWNKEGTEIAEWLNSIGFSAAVLLYRAPNQRDAALCDVQRTIGILRRDAAKYAIDPGRVGVIGFSAGANLAIRAATNWRKRFYARVDEADDFSCRPDFQLPIYPWDIRTRIDPSTPWKKWKGMELRAEYPVDAETPPAFIAQAKDDFCEIETTVAYDHYLRRAGVSSTARIYANGGHGYGLRRLGRASDVWSDEASAWLAQFAH